MFGVNTELATAGEVRPDGERQAGGAALTGMPQCDGCLA